MVKYLARIVKIHVRTRNVDRYYVSVPKAIYDLLLKKSGSVKKVAVRISNIDIGIRNIVKLGGSFYISIPPTVAQKLNDELVEVNLEVV